MSNKQFLELPYGKDDFTKLREQNCYFVDKTPYLKQVFGIDASDVLLFTRPRRFGKTLLISMFDSFLKINPEKPFDNSKQLELFKGTKILEDKEFCDKFMGQCPVITITLKKVEGTNFKEFYESFASAVYDVALRYSYLKNSNKLDKSDKDELENLTTKSYLLKIENQQTVKDALKTLSRLLYKEYGRRAILLIDEYDVPLAAASYRDRVNKVLYKNRPDFVADCHDKMVALMKGFFDLLKTSLGDEGAIGKAVITGCLKVANNSLFTGVNNFNVCSVVDREQKYTGIIGFTKDETYKFLKDYEFEDFSEKVKEHYDGYKLFDKEMFCPWDVVNFIKKNFELKQQGLLTKIKADNYWVGTSSDKSLYDYLGYLTDTDNQKMQDLVDGKSISFKLNESMNYDTLSEHDSDDFWSLLLHTGYLTLDWEKTEDEELSKDHSTNKNVVARIPNLEILDCFDTNIKARFSSEFIKHNLHNKLVNALSSGNQKEIYDIFFDMLQKYVSIRDTATKAPLENYYHGFINGIFASCESIISEYHSNYESGNGYPDITFKAERNTKAVIIEIKAAPTGSDIVTLSETALSQIEEKNYAEPFMTNRMIQSIYAYGIAFAGKNCFITCKKLK